MCAISSICSLSLLGHFHKHLVSCVQYQVPSVWGIFTNTLCATMKTQDLALRRGNSCSRSSSRKIIPSSALPRSSSAAASDSLLGRSDSSAAFNFHRLSNKTHVTVRVSSLLRSLLNMISLPTTCKWLSLPGQLSIAPPSLGRKVTGTLFGNRRGRVSFAVQYEPRAEPAVLLEFETSTAALVREMGTGLVRIALECEKKARGGSKRLLEEEGAWTMYCNGRRCGYAVSRACGEADWRVLRTVGSVSAGAGVIPVAEDGGKGSEGELMYMRARFERVVGGRDSEAFYMINPDGTGGPELSIFLLRI